VSDITVAPCVFDFGQNVDKALWQAFAGDFGSAPSTHNATFTRVSPSGAALGSIVCTAAYFTNLSVPAIDAASNATFVLRATLTPALCRQEAGSGATFPTPAIVPFDATETAAAMSGIPDQAASTDAFALGLVVSQDDVGITRDPTLLAASVSVPNLQLHYAATSSAISPLQALAKSWLVDGNHLNANEFPVTVSLDSGGVTMTFGNAGLISLDPYERSDDNAYRVKLYADTVAITGADVTG
jgi:hypothetical protein